MSCGRTSRTFCSICRPASVLAFAEKVLFIINSDTSVKAFGGDVEQQKLYECFLTCSEIVTAGLTIFLAASRLSRLFFILRSLASKRSTHFAEGQVQDLVDKNLQSLLRHCHGADDRVSAAPTM